MVLADSEAERGRAKTQAESYWDEVTAGQRVSTFHFFLTQKDWKAMHPARGSRRGPPRGRRSFEGGPPRFEGGPPPFDGGPPRPQEPRGSGGTEYSYVQGAMVVDGERYDGIGLRFKGNSSFRFSGDSPRKPFKVDTNRFVRGLKFHGRTKLNFSTAFKDPTYLKEKLGYDTYRAAGLPTPDVGWARLYLTVEGLYDAQYLGLYVLIQQVDDRFVETHFGEDSDSSLLMKPDGLRDWRYLGENAEPYDESYNIKEGEKSTELIERFAAFLRILEEGSDTAFAAAARDYVDLENLASYLAATALMTSLDSFVAAPHNYYVLVDAADRKMKILPWDVNEAWATFTLGASAEALAGWDIRRPWVGERRLLERLFEIESFQTLYLSKVRGLLAAHFTENELFARIRKYREIVKPLLADDPFGKGVEGMVDGLERSTASAPAGGPSREASIGVKPFVKMRIAAVAKQLSANETGVRLERRRRRGPR